MCTITDFITQVEDRLEERNSKLQEIAAIIEKELMTFYDERGINIISRVKSITSLKEKIKRKDYFNKYNRDANNLLNGLSDLIGIRINCLLTKEERDVFFKLADKFKNQCKDDTEYYTCTNNNLKRFSIRLINDQPQIQQNGKRIYRIDARWMEDGYRVGVEIQIKSSVNAMWGEIEHKLFYKNYDYRIEQGFYSNMMGLLHDNLETVERQIELIKGHLEKENEPILEYQEILSRLLYNEFDKKMNPDKIDYRNIYKLLAELYINNPEKIVKDLNRAMEYIEQWGERTDYIQADILDKSNFIDYSEEIQENANLLDKIFRKEDLYWKNIFKIYQVLFNIEDYTKLLIGLVTSLKNRFRLILKSASDIILDQDSITEVVIRAAFKYLAEDNSYKIFLNKNIEKIDGVMKVLGEINPSWDEADIGLLEKYFYIIFKAVANNLKEDDKGILAEIKETATFQMICDNDKERFEQLIVSEERNMEEIVKILLIGKEI